jgi:hypothetical protein
MDSIERIGMTLAAVGRLLKEQEAELERLKLTANSAPVPKKKKADRINQFHDYYTRLELKRGYTV